MSAAPLNAADARVLERSGFDRLFDALRNREFRVVGPTVRNGAIIYDEIGSSTDLPEGWCDEQEGSSYRLKQRGDAALFSYASSPHSWKQFLHPPRERLWSAKRDNKTFQIEPASEPVKTAFFGVRSCDLHAIAIQDRVFQDGQYVDPGYQGRRRKSFIIAVNCATPGGTCFCASMNTGPKAASGFDLALTEVLEPDRHYFVVEVGSEPGAEILRNIDLPAATVEEQGAAGGAVSHAASQMGRKMDTTGIRELLFANHDNACWDHVAARCLNCTNCTMVCPTCFCSSVEDTTDLSGDRAERVQRWDSCFNVQFSYIHGGSIRPSARSRYRQWLTHKLATWIDQFGTSGCVGCGRCITWCPVAIDITEEVQAIRRQDNRNLTAKSRHGVTRTNTSPASILP